MARKTLHYRVPVVAAASGSRITTSYGKTVYHCHILDHEDMGMMGTIEIA